MGSRVSAPPWREVAIIWYRGFVLFEIVWFIYLFFLFPLGEIVYLLLVPWIFFLGKVSRFVLLGRHEREKGRERRKWREGRRERGREKKKREKKKELDQYNMYVIGSKWENFAFVLWTYIKHTLESDVSFPNVNFYVILTWICWKNYTYLKAIFLFRWMCHLLFLL